MTVITPEKTDVATAVATILLVEDEDIVHRLLSQVLEMQCYKVLKATNGTQALELSREYAGSIDLLVADVELERSMTGCRLARSLRRLRPRLKVLYISGYSLDLNHMPDRGSIKREIQELLAGYLEKPFSPSDLTEKVRLVLNDFRPPVRR